VSFFRLLARTARHYWRTNVAVAVGVAAAAAVLAGALVVGDSVRGSLRDIALGRLGRTDSVVSSPSFFRAALADDLRGTAGVSAAAPLISATGFVTHESSGRRAANVLVYGVDDRFWTFNSRAARDGIYVSPALASELGARSGDVLLTRVQKPSAIPVESLFGRKEDAGRTLRLTLSSVLSREDLGEFSVQPQQAEVRALFAPLARIQRDLGVRGEVNTILVSGRAGEAALKSALKLDDLGVHVRALPELRSIAVESRSGILSDAVDAAVTKTAQTLGMDAVPVFTYLANSMRHGDRVIPYSLVTATDLAELGVTNASADAMVLNDWAAQDLGVRTGDRVDIEYYLWDPAGGLQTKTASAIVSAIVPISGFAADRRLAPEYPGITEARSLADWDPPFPVDLSRVRPVDEKYWDDYRTTPKAFIPFERGRELWRSRYGQLTSVRFHVAEGSDPNRIAARLESGLMNNLSPGAAGLVLYPARAAALQASGGAADFGEYFVYFSFFIVVSALLLVVLFFRLGVEQRLRQIGTFRAMGYPIRLIARLLLAEGTLVAALGGLAGAAGALLYAQFIVYGLRTWWNGAVGTTLLRVHPAPLSLVLGVAGAVIAAVLCVLLSLRTVRKMTPRALLTAQSVETGPVDAARLRRRYSVAVAFALIGFALLTLGFFSPSAQVGAFFGAGSALLVAALLYFAASLRRRQAGLINGRGPWAVSRLGFRSAAFRPARSVLSAALIAAAAFVILSLDAFRRGAGELSTDTRSGSGGYALLAQSEVPLVQNPNTADGRDALMIRDAQLAGARFARFRLHQGQDASCLNLYRPTHPTIIGAERAFADQNRFAFAASLAETDEERSNPWLLLRRRFDDGAVPAIADATSLQYALHARVGDRFSIDTGAATPLVLRFVGALRDSVLQGELVIAEERFVGLFPAEQGYRFFLIDHPSVRTAAEANALAGVVERELEPFGVDAVTTAERLAAFHRVENTYLSTFQALGGLGLVLGTVGVATVMFRNVLERRRELALLRAVGYDGRHLSLMIVAEASLLLTAGLIAGLGCAALAVSPAWMQRGGSRPGAGLAAVVAGVVVVGMVSSWMAARAAAAGPVLDALRTE
jgi:putative ABC transport system permease protein